MGKSMQNIIEEKRQRIKSQIKNFFETNNIQYKEIREKYSNRIEIKGKLFSVSILPLGEIDISISKDEVLTIEDRKDKILIVYYKAFPEEYETKLEIKKSEFETVLPAIYYLENKLVFLF